MRPASGDGPDGHHDLDPARFPRLSDDTSELVFRTTRAGRYTYVSPSVRPILGYEPKELLGQDPLESVHPDDLTRLAMAGDRLAGGSVRETVVVRKRHADGHYVWLEGHITPVRDPTTNEVLELQARARDVTSQVATERALRQRVSADALIGEASRELLAVSADEVDAVVVQSLERAARFVSADRATLVVLSPDEQMAVRTHQWANEPDFESEADFPLAAMPWLVEQCRTRQLLFARSLDELPPQASAERGVFERAGVRSFACLPITTGGRLRGGLAFNWRTREAGDCAPALSALRVLSDVLVVALDRKRAEQALANSEGRFRSLVDDAALDAAPPGIHILRPMIEHVIATRGFEPLFQPVADLRTRDVVGFEALTRFDDGVPPDLRFHQAAQMDLGVELEHATMEAAIDAAATLPPEAFVSINVSPALILERQALAVAARAASRPLVLELTEREPVDDYGALAKALEQIGGVQLAVDDAGAGYASLRHILAMRPSYIKLDITWVRDIHKDTARQALVVGINHFATLTKCRVIAEGVETEAEVDTLHRVGVEFGQGFLFGRPQPVGAYLDFALRS